MWEVIKKRMVSVLAGSECKNVRILLHLQSKEWRLWSGFDRMSQITSVESSVLLAKKEKQLQEQCCLFSLRTQPFPVGRQRLSPSRKTARLSRQHFTARRETAVSAGYYLLCMLFLNNCLSCFRGFVRRSPHEYTFILFLKCKERLCREWRKLQYTMRKSSRWWKKKGKR